MNFLELKCTDVCPLAGGCQLQFGAEFSSCWILAKQEHPSLPVPDARSAFMCCSEAACAFVWASIPTASCELLLFDAHLSF